ncbi:MAG: hypothetical protein CL891_01010 [Dehalococcoidia bacterium]|nr:hypothetical protein [Dehalococcoidia bacterium]
MKKPILDLVDGEQTVFFQAGEEWCFLRTPRSYRLDGPSTPCVIQCHGHHGFVKDGSADWLSDNDKLAFITALTEAGIAVASSHATGNHWGRPSAVAANAALFQTLLDGTNLDEKRMGLWGGGLGGALLWNSVTGPLLGKVKAIVLQQATISYESVIRNHKFKDKLLEAYGLPPDCDDDLAVSSLQFDDPVNRTRILVKQRGQGLAELLPNVLFIHGDQDENMLYKENPVRLGEVMSPSGAKYAFHTFQGVGHATYALGNIAAEVLVNFFKREYEL